MPEPGDVITLIGDTAIEIEGYDNEHGWVDCHVHTPLQWRLCPSIEEVKKRGVYVSRADGKSVLVREEASNG
jgi:hypothetical protein